MFSFLISLLFGGGSNDGFAYDANVAVIPIKGVITVEESSDLFGNSNVASSDAIIRSIKKAQDNPNIKALILEINSPGGSPVASDEIGRAIKESNLTTVAVIREIGTSGAYWIASASDHIIANRMSITGSIGVIGSYLEFSDLLTRFNVTYRRFVSGKYKDIGSPFREITEEETTMYQAIIDKMLEFFIEEVALNRNMSIRRTRELATGLVYLGSEAKEVGLVDELGSMQEADRYLERTLNISVRTTVLKENKGLSDLLAGISTTKFIYPADQIMVRT
jgi:protease-4